MTDLRPDKPIATRGCTVESRRTYDCHTAPVPCGKKVGRPVVPRDIGFGKYVPTGNGRSAWLPLDGFAAPPRPLWPIMSTK